MARTGSGLSDNHRTILGIVIYSLIAINAYVGVEVAQGRLPAAIIPVLAIAAIVAGVIKDQLGIRDSTISAVAKEENPNYPTFRTP